ncbi:hypothetical protein BWZ22_15305 [Seonamhaeicola sp. S2-3]|uniref:endonuclease n=1 Tax=Seonamhaeicola sp. S2-3 TaxID=1936081 RepID=UPI0009728950|nr:endonuclease [Seonamhaeicola sp. S2-3]APY12500.1 hypothetical protein BWZ22_15305 [Seonamhaeicola sp. S2-3]
MRLLRLYISLLAVFFSLTVSAQIPTYYSNIDFSQTDDALKNQISTLITTTLTNQLPYTSASTDTWDVIKTADLDPSNNQNVLLLYGYDDLDNTYKTDRTRSKDLNCTSNSCIGLWNREHVFAKSLANPSLDTSYPSAGTDVHNLLASDSQMNSSRNNRVYASGSGNSTITAQGYFYPGDEWKGDIARIIMYMYVRYPNQCLANDVAFSSNSTHPDMPDIFLQWNIEDPVSNFEIQRNNEIALAQGNRNPFIDNPYIATLIWGGTPAADSWQVLALPELYNQESVSIYPTISTNYLNIVSNKTNNYQYTIVDYSGRILLNATVANKVDISRLNTGSYILHLKSNQSESTFRFIKK